MTRTAGAILLLVFPGLAAAQAAPTLQQQLTAELSGRSFVTRIGLQSLFSSQPGIWSYVVTTVEREGEPTFRRSAFTVAERGRPIPRPPTCGGATINGVAGTLCRIDAGGMVTVTSISLSGSHLTIGYWPVEISRVGTSAASAEFRVALEKDWQKTMSATAVMEVLGDVLVIGSVEQRRALDRTYTSLRQLAAAALTASSVAPVERRIQDAERLHGLLVELVANREAYERTVNESAAQEIASYRNRIRELNGEIERLRRVQ